MKNDIETATAEGYSQNKFAKFCAQSLNIDAEQLRWHLRKWREKGLLIPNEAGYHESQLADAAKLAATINRRPSKTKPEALPPFNDSDADSDNDTDSDTDADSDSDADSGTGSDEETQSTEKDNVFLKDNGDDSDAELVEENPAPMEKPALAKQAKEKQGERTDLNIPKNSWESQQLSTTKNREEITSTVDALPVTLETRAAHIRQLRVDIARNYIAIGFELIAAKAQIERGGWTNWLKDNFNWTQRNAQYLMAIAERFGNANTYSHLGLSTMKAMLSLPAGSEKNFIAAQADNGNPVENLSAREVKSAVKQWNQQHNSGVDDSREEKPPAPLSSEKILTPKFNAAIRTAINAATVDDVQTLQELHNSLLRLTQELADRLNQLKGE